VAAAVDSLGGPANEADIAGFVHRHFSKELAAKQDLLEAAASPEAARFRRLTPASLDLLAAEGAGLDDGSGSDEAVTVARTGPSRAALDSGERTSPAARRDAVTIPMQPSVARFDSEPPVEAADPDPIDPASVAPPVPEPIEPAPTEAIRHRQRWRGTPPWMPRLALLFAGVCGIAALLYWLL
jgi:hypothetical protein